MLPQNPPNNVDFVPEGHSRWHFLSAEVVLLTIQFVCLSFCILSVLFRQIATHFFALFSQLFIQFVLLLVTFIHSIFLRLHRRSHPLPSAFVPFACGTSPELMRQTLSLLSLNVDQNVTFLAHGEDGFMVPTSRLRGCSFVSLHVSLAVRRLLERFATYGTLVRTLPCMNQHVSL